MKAENNIMQALKQNFTKNNSSSYNLEEEGFYKSLVFYIFFQILEENLLWRSSLIQERLHTAQTNLLENKTAKNIKLTPLGASLAARPPAGSGNHFFAKAERDRVEVT